MRIEHDFDFDPTAGFSPELLRSVEPPPDEPDDFDDYWCGIHRETAHLSLRLSKREIWSPVESVRVYEVAFDSLDGVRIGGWLLRPDKSIGGVVQGHGYGGRKWCDFDLAKDNFTTIQFCVRGFQKSTTLDIPWSGHEHVLHGIESKEAYVIKGAVVDTWQAASALLEIFPDTASNLNYSGASFGGGMGALTLPWDKRFRTGQLHVPTFGHHPIRLKYKSIGSAEAVRQYYLRHPEVVGVLKYFDAATAAKRIKIPVLCSPAFFDPAVIPPGQFAIANALPTSGEVFEIPAGHFSLEGEQEIMKMLHKKTVELFNL